MGKQIFHKLINVQLLNILCANQAKIAFLDGHSAKALTPPPTS